MGPSQPFCGADLDKDTCTDHSDTLMGMKQPFVLAALGPDRAALDLLCATRALPRRLMSGCVLTKMMRLEHLPPQARDAAQWDSRQWRLGGVPLAAAGSAARVATAPPPAAFASGASRRPSKNSQQSAPPARPAPKASLAQAERCCTPRKPQLLQRQLLATVATAHKRGQTERLAAEVRAEPSGAQGGEVLLLPIKPLPPGVTSIWGTRRAQARLRRRACLSLTLLTLLAELMCCLVMTLPGPATHSRRSWARPAAAVVVVLAVAGAAANAQLEGRLLDDGVDDVKVADGRKPGGRSAEQLGRASGSGRSGRCREACT